MSQQLPIIVAHRGLHHRAVESSLEAFISAARAGVSWVECDVWPSREGIPVVIHDDTLDRTTAGAGPVGSYSCGELAAFGVPALEEVLSVLADHSTGILIEIKPPDAGEFRAMVEKQVQSWSNPWMIQSFHAENVQPCDRHALLVENIARLRAGIEDPWRSIHAEHSLIDRRVVDELHGTGRKIGAWTVNDAEDIRRMVELGVDMVITDEPELAMTICGSAIDPEV